MPGLTLHHEKRAQRGQRRGVVRGTGLLLFCLPSLALSEFLSRLLPGRARTCTPFCIHIRYFALRSRKVRVRTRDGMAPASGAAKRGFNVLQHQQAHGTEPPAPQGRECIRITLKRGTGWVLACGRNSRWHHRHASEASCFQFAFEAWRGHHRPALASSAQPIKPPKLSPEPHLTPTRCPTPTSQTVMPVERRFFSSPSAQTGVACVVEENPPSLLITLRAQK